MLSSVRHFLLIFRYLHIMIKDRHFKLNDSQKTSSQESFTIDYAREAPYIKPLKL